MTWIDVALIVARYLLAIVFILSLAPLLIWADRKVSSWIQDRPGPERAAIGPFRLAGLLHPLADAVKLIGKEDIIPNNVNRFYYLLAPCVVVGVFATTAAIIPWWDTVHMPNGYTFHGATLDINPGILWFFAIVSLTVYGPIFAGWSSNNKYSLLGAMRASAAVLSYEIPMGLAAIVMVMTYGTVSLNGMAQLQGGEWFGFIPKWGIFIQPIAAIIFIVCAFAETNRAPFDLAEAEAELVAGYHTEYSALKWGMFMFAEYGAMTVSSALIAILFFGGWQVPYFTTAELVANAQVLTQWILGISFVASLVLTALFLGYFARSIGVWKDMRDYEGLILAILVLGGGATALLGMFVMMAIDLPSWYGPIFAAVVQFHALVLKIVFWTFVFVWVRWTLPRFRYDQVMNLGWRSMLPLALVNILVTGLLITVFKL
jgi:NADH-quinone oxidoreductase subunit H